MEDFIIIAGKTVKVIPMTKGEMEGVFPDAQLTYSFYKAEYQGSSFVLLKPKSNQKLTPVYCKRLTEVLTGTLQKPCVIWFTELASYERNRFIEHGVYFVVSSKYVYLPFMLINARAGAPVNKERLQPAAQYLLLYQLQSGGLDGCTLLQLEQKLPYNYLALSRAVRQLEAMVLIEVSTDSTGTKTISFTKPSRQLWEESEPLMQNPIKAVWYSDESLHEGVTGGINALSYYSELNPERMETKVLFDTEFKELREQNRLPILNKMEGTTKIEVWRHRPVLTKDNVVDCLSLYLTLRDDKDPRVEKELETIIRKLW